jgi:hypothetical protein
MTTVLEEVLEPGEPVFASQQWGSWVEFALPDHPVFVDSRWEVIPDRAWDAYGHVSAMRSGWQRILDRHGIDTLALASAQQPEFMSFVRRDPAWTKVYEDTEGAVFVRSDAG